MQVNPPSNVDLDLYDSLEFKEHYTVLWNNITPKSREAAARFHDLEIEGLHIVSHTAGRTSNGGYIVFESELSLSHWLFNFDK